MKPTSSPNSRYYFGDYLQSSKDPSLSNASSRSKRKLKTNRPNPHNLNLTNRQYFPDSDTIANNSSSLSNIVSPRGPRFHRHVHSAKLSRDGTVNSSKKSSRLELERQVSRLASELKLKNKSSQNGQYKQQDPVKKSELIELYRTANFYEGKIKKLEEDALRYESLLKQIGRQCDQKSKHKSQVEKLVLLFEEMRTENQMLSGRLEEKEYEIGRLNDQLHKEKVNRNILMKRSPKSKSAMSESRSQISNRTFQSATQLSAKKDMYGNIYSKINTIESSLTFFKKQNDRLHEQLAMKDQNIQQLTETISSLEEKIDELEKKSVILNKSREGSKLSLRGKKTKGEDKIMRQNRDNASILKRTYSKQDPLNQVVVLPKNMLRQISKPVPASSDVPVSEKSPLQSNDKFKEVSKKMRPDILRRIKYQLITEEVEYSTLLETLLSEETEAQVFEQYPYNLPPDEAEWLIQWLGQAREQAGGESSSSDLTSYLKEVIPKYESISLRQQNNMKIQVYNAYLNRQAQLEEQAKNWSEGTTSYQKILGYFQNWPITQKHLDVLGKNIYEETGKIGEVEFSLVVELIKKWGQ